MRFSLISPSHAVAPLFAILCATSAQAQTTPAEACYADKDVGCLEALFEDILKGPTPENAEAINLLGQLHQDSGNFSEAKKTYQMGVAFAQSEKSRTALVALFATHPEAFDEPTDCLSMNSTACFEAIIANGEGNAVRNAQYLYAKGLRATDAPRAAALLEASAAAGHGTSPCLLHDLYRDGAEGVPADYNKSVVFGLQCAPANPFPRLNTEHFAKYEATEDHRAYAFAENGVASYDFGVVDADIAARLAFEFCNASPHRNADSPACRVINIDGTWVDGPEPPSLPAFSGTVEGLIRVEALTSYQNEYSTQDGIKVFVQSKNGSWTWRASTEPDATLEDLTAQAMELCTDSWRAKLDYPCEVVNINGDWVP